MYYWSVLSTIEVGTTLESMQVPYMNLYRHAFGVENVSIFAWRETRGMEGMLDFCVMGLRM